MSSFDENCYGPVFAILLKVDRRRALDTGTPHATDRDRLISLTVDNAFAHAQVVNDDAARCCLSAIWLLYDFLDDSHAISQNITTAEGSFWHGIMHRREGDYSNAKYWFRRVGQHPVFRRLANGWDPHEFVDACQAALGTGGADEDNCRRLQQAEWEQLFDYCYQVAIT